MNFADLRNVAGLLIIIALPYMSGYMLKTLFNKRETGQIETYLMGFFLVFLIQGVYFTVGSMLMGYDFNTLCDDFDMVVIILAAISVVVIIIGLILRKKDGTTSAYRLKLSRYDMVLIGIMSLIALLICVRVIGIIGYIRDDYILPTVRITLSTGTVNEYNPLTAMPYRVGLTTSKKIVTLPVYYSYLCRNFGFEPIILLYVIMTLLTVVCTYFSCTLFIKTFIKQREKIFLYSIFFGGVILSGDYFNRAIGGRLLWNGYAGSTITTAVMLPYMMFLVVSSYKAGRVGVADVIRMLLVLGASLFISSITYGALLISITGVVTLIACLITGRKQFEEDDVNIAVGSK